MPDLETDEQLPELLQQFERAERLLTDLGEAIAKADSGNIFGVDLIVNAALGRALSVIRGFNLLIKDRNFVSAAPLIRLQLDNCLRLYALSLVDDPHVLAVKVLGGQHISRVMDRNGKKMRDAYLVTQLSEKFPWVQEVYDQTSGYIHLSEKHFFATVQKVANRRVTFRIAAQDSEFLPASVYVEATEVFLEVTRLFAKILGSWWHAKEEAGLERQGA